MLFHNFENVSNRFQINDTASSVIFSRNYMLELEFVTNRVSSINITLVTPVELSYDFCGFSNSGLMFFWIYQLLSSYYCRIVSFINSNLWSRAKKWPQTWSITSIYRVENLDIRLKFEKDRKGNTDAGVVFWWLYDGDSFKMPSFKMPKLSPTQNRPQNPCSRPTSM